MTQEMLLSISGLRLSYGKTEVLRGIDLDVAKGEATFVIGPSGSGKSSLLRCCNRLEEPDAGNITVDGQDLLANGVNLNQVRQRIGMVFQSFNLYPHMTALGNVRLALRRVRKFPRNKADEVARAQLQRVGLDGHLNKYPAQLSGGQQQRVAIARALALEPKVMLFDEPTSALDPELVGEVLNVLSELKADGMTMVIVSHEMRFARHAADRVMFMADGEIVEAGPPEQIFDAPMRQRTREFVGQATH
ncbi:MAG: amino acid ABC transporter ATP-binding protein [Pseudomonadota bacterium]